MAKIVKTIFKTHLDVGFTDSAANVIDCYMENFIPSAIRTAEYFKRQPGSFRYRWTVASWLIYEYLKRNKGRKRRLLEKAIADNEIVWHSLPFTSHTELADRSLFEYGLSLSHKLDSEFGKKTIAAKLTDVPGHTRGIIAPLADAGVKLLHIGINPASACPTVPSLFRWRDSAGHEIIVVYHQAYGKSVLVGDTEFAIHMTGDNRGPHTPEEVKKILSSYPDSDIRCSDLNELAAAIVPDSGSLPVLTSEIGDSWIHGVGTDPRKTAEFRELCRLRNKWRDFPEKDDFSRKIMMIYEHTWGLDEKSFFNENDAWTPESLQSESALKFAASWEEKRRIITDAVNVLPPEKRCKAENAIKALRPTGKIPIQPTGETVFENDFARLEVDPESGTAKKIILKDDHFEFRNSGLFTYQTYSRQDYERFKLQYLRIFKHWARHDFSKPEMPETFKSEIHAGFKAEIKVSESKTSKNIYLISGKLPGFERVVIEYVMPHDKAELEIRLKWFGKELMRQAHAMWLSMVPAGKNQSYAFYKLGEPVDPTDVVSRGARTLHAVKNVIVGDNVVIDNLDAPLVAPGQMSLLDFHDRNPAMDGGLHFNLYNNVWGTNFPMWFNDDMSFRFIIRKKFSETWISS